MLITNNLTFHQPFVSASLLCRQYQISKLMKSQYSCINFALRNFQLLFRSTFVKMDTVHKLRTRQNLARKFAIPRYDTSRPQRSIKYGRIKGGESSSQFWWFTIAKIELYFLIFFVLILGLRLQRYSTNTKRYLPKKVFRNSEF